MTPDSSAATVTIQCPACYQAFGPDCDDPVKLRGAPIGQYHCPGCGVMQLAGIPHIKCDECEGTGKVTMTRERFDAIPEKYRNRLEVVDVD